MMEQNLLDLNQQSHEIIELLNQIHDNIIALKKNSMNLFSKVNNYLIPKILKPKPIRNKNLQANSQWNPKLRIPTKQMNTTKIQRNFVPLVSVFYNSAHNAQKLTSSTPLFNSRTQTEPSQVQIKNSISQHTDSVVMQDVYKSVTDASEQQSQQVDNEQPLNDDLDWDMSSVSAVSQHHANALQKADANHNISIVAPPDKSSMHEDDQVDNKVLSMKQRLSLRFDKQKNQKIRQFIAGKQRVAISNEIVRQIDVPDQGLADEVVEQNVATMIPENDLRAGSTIIDLNSQNQQNFDQVLPDNDNGFQDNFEIEDVFGEISLKNTDQKAKKIKSFMVAMEKYFNGGCDIEQNDVGIFVK